MCRPQTSRLSRTTARGTSSTPPRSALGVVSQHVYHARVRTLTALALLFAGCIDDVDRAQSSVVYGEDGRTEVYAHASEIHRAIAESAIAMQVHQSWVDTSNPNDVRITRTTTLTEDKNLCAGQPFENQPDPGTCSGTLIDDRHLLTAGHCVETAQDCTDRAWVFGYHYVSDGVLATLTSDDVYRCQETFAYVDTLLVDHVVVRFDRPVVGHTPATIRREPAGLAVGTPLVLIGHPNGIPMKIDSGGSVTYSSNDARWLRATVDAFNANSGSGVFDAEGRLVAVLFSGETDYVDSGGCNIVNVVQSPAPGAGETLVYVDTALDAFCASAGATAALCPPSAFAGDRCADAELLPPISRTVEGTLSGYSALTTGSCGGDGPERSYAFVLTEAMHLRANASGTVLYLRDGCGGTELACNALDAPLEAMLEAGPYVLVVDSSDASAAAFTLELTFSRAPLDGGTTGPDGGGTDAGTGPIASDGCGCRAAPTGPNGRWLALALLLFVLRRRTRFATR